MTDLTYTIIDGDFPVGVKNKTATLVTSEDEALLDRSERATRF